MSAFIFKIISLISMLIDHTGAVLFQDMLFLRFIGRIAFPIYSFFIVQGAIHSHDIKKYARKLAILALVSEIPYNLAFDQSILHFGSTNILFLYAIFIISLTLHEERKKEGKDTFYIILASGVLAFLISPDGSIVYYAVMWLMYRSCKKYKDGKPSVPALVLCALIILICEAFPHYITSGMGMADYLLHGGAYIFLGIFISFILLYFYNGKKGRSEKVFNTIFYLSYPVHLILLYFLSVAESIIKW